MSYVTLEPPRHLEGKVPGRVRDTLERWLWVRIPKGDTVTYHVLGYRKSDGVTYITSPLTAVDPISHRVRTFSGSTYLLEWQSEVPDMRLHAHLWEALRLWKIEI